jgi:hypothetical protein
MPRVHIERVAFCALCAACGWVDVEHSTERAKPAQTLYETDQGSATIAEGTSDGAPGTLSSPIDEVDDGSTVCQSLRFASDPLSAEANTPSCTASLTTSVLNPSNVLVKIAGKACASGSEDGWQLLEDGVTVLLLGLACDDVLAGADLELSALCE